MNVGKTTIRNNEIRNNAPVPTIVVSDEEIGIMLMAIRIRLSILMPMQIQIRILPNESFTHAGKSENLFTFIHRNHSNASSHCFICHVIVIGLIFSQFWTVLY